MIILKSGVAINQFLHRNESYIVEEGLRTTTIREGGKKDVSVTVSGFHPNTKDYAVIRYLARSARKRRWSTMYFQESLDQVCVLGN